MTDVETPDFRFVVLADTHLRVEAATSATPWRTNQLANARSRFVAEQIERIGPAFVIHLGDMVHPVPTMPDHAEAVEAFRNIYGKLTAPLYTIPGNHDIGDKPGEWMPAPNVSEESVSTYRHHFGETYSAFEHQGCRFLLINAPVLNSGLSEEREQREWLEAELADHLGERLFLFTHYPPLLDEPTEPSHYDNVDRPARAWLLSLIERYRVEAVFAGHIHNFSYNRLDPADFYVVPSVTSLRQDYSELFRIGPAAEYGRNDADKLGFFAVTVHPRGHALRFVRTGGRTLGDEPSSPSTGSTRSSSTSSANSTAAYRLPLGVDLSHPWAEVVPLPCNYLVDPFVRKRIVNDYPLLALLTLGSGRLRIPASDLLDPRTRDRLELLGRQGLEASVLYLGVPDAKLFDCLRENSKLVRSLEVVLSRRALDETGEQLRDLKESTGLPLLFCPLETSADTGAELAKGNYHIRYGFPSDQPSLETTLQVLQRESPALDGFGFRVRAGQSPWDAAEGIAGWAARAGCLASATVQIAADTPAEAVEDDARIANRVAEAAAAALSFPAARVVLDTFADNDRGYYVRHGVVDRRYNPRLAGHVLAHFTAVVSEHAEEIRPERRVRSAHGVRLEWRTETHRFALLLPEPGSSDIPLSAWDLPEPFRRAARHDLATGEERSPASQNTPLPPTPHLFVTPIIEVSRLPA